MGLFGSLRGPNAQVAFGTISRQSCSLSLVHKNIYKRKCTPGTNTNPIPFPGDTDMTSSFRTASPEKQTSYLTAYFHIFYSPEIFTTVYKQFRKTFRSDFTLYIIIIYQIRTLLNTPTIPTQGHLSLLN
jgi:hypothetical protein